jgi:hypothetical protein
MTHRRRFGHDLPTAQTTGGRPPARPVVRLTAARVAAMVAMTAAAMQSRGLAAQTPSPADTTPTAVATHVLGDSGVTPALPCLPPVDATPAVLSDSGTFLYDLVPEESDNVRSAVERAIAHMSFITRPIARRRLMKANRPPPRLTFDVRSDTIAVTFDGVNPIVTPRSGEAVAWVRGQTGERYDVRIVQSGDTLRQEIAADDGRRENYFLFLDGGARVELHVVLSADRLPRPLSYMLVFRRASRPLPVGSISAAPPDVGSRSVAETGPHPTP